VIWLKHASSGSCVEAFLDNFDNIWNGLIVLAPLQQVVHGPLPFKLCTHCKTSVHMPIILVYGVTPRTIAVYFPLPPFKP
jgi:hypothetical protein